MRVVGRVARPGLGTRQCSSWRERRRTRLPLSLVCRLGHHGPLCGLLHSLSPALTLLHGTSAEAVMRVVRGREGACGSAGCAPCLPGVQQQ